MASQPTTLTVDPQERTAPEDSFRRHPSYLLAYGFGTSVVMWGVGFVCRMPPVWVPSSVLLFLLLACQLGGGFLAARGTGLGLRAGAGVGAVSAAVNLLVLGSLLGGSDPGQLVPTAAIWLPGSLLAGALLGGLGGMAALRFPGAAGATISPARASFAMPGAPPSPSPGVVTSGSGAGAGAPRRLAPPLWTGRFAQVAALATLLLLVVGGMVTSKEAGLAVVDWPNSFGYNMFLFPLARMTGGVYFEHSHRLFGALVGLTTLVLAIHLRFAEPRRWVRNLAWVALVMVVVQGILGGLRVTGKFTTTTDPSMTAPSLTLAFVHGIFGQIFFATLVALAAVTAPSWQLLPPAAPRADARRDHLWTSWAVALVLPQLVLGALYRHLEGGLVLHVTFAFVVASVAFVAGIRGFGLHADLPFYARLGKLLTGLVTGQLALGFGALVAVSLARGAPEPPTYEVVVATTHQATGAAILAVSTLMLVWSRRLFRAP